MFFNQRNKLTFGPTQEEPAILAEKLQAIAYVGNGCFEGDITDVDRSEKDPVVWRLSDHIQTAETIGFVTEDKIKQAFDNLENKLKNKKNGLKDKQARLDEIALKYNFGQDEIKDQVKDDQESVDLYIGYTEEDESIYDDENTILNKDRHYFGLEAKNEFWDIYKSGRTFKDQAKNDIKDPRLAYLKTCHDLKMLPKASMVIREEKTTDLSFANFGLLHKNSMAVAESLKRYPLEIQTLDFTGNGIRAKECIMLVNSLEPHYNTLLNLNFSENKIGYDGAVVLGEALVNIKQLESINLASNLLGDLAIDEVLKGMLLSANLKEINFSNNSLGQKSSESQFIHNLNSIIKNSNTLVKLDLSWNNLRGEVAEIFIESLKENYSITSLDLSYNLFGVSSSEGLPAATKFSEVLHENTILEEINLSNNLIDSKVAFCLAHGIRNNTSLKSFNIEGNPIGSSGIKFLIQSINDNAKGKVENLKMKETETIIPSNAKIFDPMNVDGEYQLDLENIYDRVILYHLLDIDEKIYQNSPEEEGMEQGDWFLEAKHSGSSWTSPKEKDKDGKWDLGPEPKDKLTFRFSLDPKRNQKPGPKDPELPTGTIIDYKSVIKPVISDAALEKSIDLLIRLLLEENSTCQREMVATMAQEYYFTFYQAREILKTINEEDKVYAWVTLFNRIVNRHLRNDLIQLLPTYDAKLIAMHQLSSAFSFTYYNPTGHYKLKLSNPVEREVALTLLMFNRKFKILVDQGDVTDRSKMGNRSWFRNEKLSGVSFTYDENFVLPAFGTFECDFIYLLNPPHKDEQTSEEKLDMIKDLLMSLEGNLEQQIISFRALSEYLVISSKQLSMFVELIDDPKWIAEWYIAGVGRIFDIRNFDFIKKKWKYPESSKEIYNRFGIFNLFNPHKCTGSYRLDLSIYEERIVCLMLLELAKAEGYQYMTNVLLNSKSISEINKEFVDNLPQEGVFEGSYVPNEDAANYEARERIGRKNFDWTSDDLE